jgi:hypothetical protein
MALVLVFAVTAAGQGDSPAQSMQQYAAKFICGVAPPLETSNSTPVASPGRYFTAINVHNPARATSTTVYKKFTVGLPAEEVGAVTQYFEMQLAGDETMQIDCGNIARHLNRSQTAFLEGYAVIESLKELDVVAVYTAGSGVGADVASIHTERVQPRRMPACGKLDLNISTGVALWTLVSAPTGPVPRAATILGPGFFPLPNSSWISGTSSGQTGQKPGSVWEYETCFCICPGAQRIQFDLSGVKVDDDSQFFLNGTLLGPLSSQTPPQTVVDTINTNANASLRTGRSCLRVRVVDTIGGFSGLDLVGTIKGASAACE